MKDIVAAFVFFTRLPIWRLLSVDSRSFKRVVNYWSVVGVFTGGVMALSFFLISHILPVSVALIFAFLSRLLITGALHEDGLADFFDGFGGGTTKDRILAIMKDSHIGTYGVLSLILYFVLLLSLLSSISLQSVCIILFVSDPCCKFIASLITLRLAYARTEDASKAKVVYDKMSIKPFIISAIFGLTPFIYFIPSVMWWVLLFPVVTFCLMTSIMAKKIEGYTGDCCGAIFLLCELSLILGLCIAVY